MSTPRDKLNAWTKGLGVAQPSCPICRRNQWRIHAIVAADVLKPVEAEDAEPLPMAQIVCTWCAYVLLLDARAVGLA